MKLSLIAPLSLLATPCTPAFSLQTDVAIVAAAASSSGDCRFVDTQQRIEATGFFSSVDVIDAGAGTPTLAELMTYDAIITWSNFNFADSAALGNVLADYHDAGGGVVVASFANSSDEDERSLQGRWAGTYEVIVSQLGTASGAATLGTVLIPGHPVMAGVTSFSGGSSSFRPATLDVVSGSTVIAEWSDGSLLAVAGPLPRRVDLGFYPASSACRSDFWDTTTDGDILMANALRFVTDGSISTSYCAANANSTGFAATIAGFGSPNVATNDLTLRAASLPAFSFAFFITSQTQGFVANPGGSSGNLCLTGSVGRFVGPGQIQQAGTGGTIELMVDLTQIPQPNGLVSALAGETWNFQAWYRDAVGGTPTSNFTDGISIDFL